MKEIKRYDQNIFIKVKTEANYEKNNDVHLEIWFTIHFKKPWRN